MTEYIDTPEAQAARLARIKLAMAEVGVTPVGDYRDKPIDYIDIAPPKFNVQVSLVETFERIKRFKADAWQKNFCEYLQNACINQHIDRTWAVVHASGQQGKSVILAQVYPAWILGHDPMHRIALATYNVTRSQSHSKAVIDIMNLPIYREMFRDPAGWVKKGSAMSGWQTEARKASTESQLSFNPVGLQSGLTGSGFSTLIIDDPYSDQKEAFSETIRTNLQEFWDFTVGSRIGLHTNIFAMFHRYHCLLPDSLVETPHGLRKIFDLKYGDSVLTSNGVEAIHGTGVRRHSGEIRSIQIAGQPRPLSVTPDHRLLTSDGWKEAQDIRPGDYVKFPIPQGTTPERFLIDLWPDKPTPRVVLPSRNTGEKRRVDREQFTEMYLSGMSCQAIANKLGYKSGQAMQRYVTLWGLNRATARSFNQNPMLDPDLWRLIGYWIAEGSIGKPKEYVRLTFNRDKEQWIVDDVAAILAKYGIPISAYPHATHNVVQIQFSSKQLITVLKCFGVGAHSKWLPEWAVMLPPALGRELVRGYLEGDGCIRRKNGIADVARMASCSHSLLASMRRLLMRLGVVGSIYSNKSAFGSQTYELRFPLYQAPWLLADDDKPADTKQRFSYIRDGWLYSRVREVSSAMYEGNVCDISTPSHDFLSSGITVHNCNDLGGYLLDTGDFDYLRYAAIADGPYIHEETGIKYEDPLNREIGELVAPERFPLQYYAKARQNTRVWNSMFQGKPTSDEGDFFQVGKIKLLEDVAELEQRRQECVAFARAWDNAATDDGGDTTVGILGGMNAAGELTVFDAILEQLDSGARLAKQVATAEADGKDTAVCIPQDPGSAGKDVVFMTEQALEGYTVAVRPTSASKESRAIPVSAAVNTNQVSMVKAEWNKRVLTSLRDFPLSDFDDPVDAMSDLYSHLYKLVKQGLVVKNYHPQRSIVPWSLFAGRYGAGAKLDKIPGHWTLYIGVKVTADATRPNSAVLVARAAKNANMPEALFVVAEYKAFTANYMELFDWIDAALDCYTDGGKDAIIWLHPDSEQYKQVIWQKLKRNVVMFEGDATAGLTELDYYFNAGANINPFNPLEREAGMYLLISDEAQVMAATDGFGLASLRQEARTWGYNDKGEPNATGAVLDCLRMVTHCFRTVQAEYSLEEKIENALPVSLRAESIEAMADPGAKDGALSRRMIESKRIQKDLDAPVRGSHSRIGRRR